MKKLLSIRSNRSLSMRIAFLFACLIAVTGLFQAKFRAVFSVKTESTTLSTTNVYAKKIMEKRLERSGEDRKLALSRSSTSRKRFESLMNLALLDDPLALEEALKISRSENEFKKVGAIKILGQIEDERALKRLEEIYASGSQGLRVSVLNALGARASKERDAILVQALSRGDLSDAERFSAYSSLYVTNNQPDVKSEIVGKVIALARSTSSRQVEDRAASFVILRAPSDPRVVAYARVLEKKREPRFAVEKARRMLATLSR